ncbi:MAG TPA: cytidine deaminase, partial [Actinomycetota bacterium]|nr:cytidine deaminase [Actinomycetota bacterium]
VDPVTGIDTEKLISLARQSMQHAHAPYSGLSVGAALLAGRKLFRGANVENASFSATICAERVAAASAVAAGARDLVAIGIVTSGVRPVPPCGICRQFLSEFGSDLVVVSEGSGGERKTWRLKELLPETFGGAFLRP